MYRKFKADQLFTGTEMLTGNNVLVTNEKGKVEKIINEKDAGENVEIFKGIISPGFINAHCHLELSHMKGLIPEKTGLVDFVFRVVSERHFGEEEILNKIEKAEAEMYANGIVAVGDICNNVLTLPQKLKQNLFYYNFIEASGWLPGLAQQRFERALNIYNEFNSQWSIVNSQLAIGLQQSRNSQTTNYKLKTINSLVPHAPYSVSENLWQLIIPYFENKVVSIHNQETGFEDEFFQKGTGDFLRMFKMMNIDNSFFDPHKKSSLQSHFSKLKNAASVILVHNTFIKQGDIDFIKLQTLNLKLQTSFCLCVNANKYIEDALPPINMLMQNDCNIVLGTDSLASNWSLNLLDEMKTIQKNFHDISLATMLQWATINGATALMVDDVFGSFEKGKMPGVVCLNWDLLDEGNFGIKRIV